MKRASSDDSFWGADVYVYIENNSETDATFQARDVSISRFMINPIFSSKVIILLVKGRGENENSTIL